MVVCPKRDLKSLWRTTFFYTPKPRNSLHHQDFPRPSAGADKIKPIVPDRDFLVEASVKQAAGSRVDADFGFYAFGANHVVLSIDPALGLQVRHLIAYRRAAVGHQAENHRLQIRIRVCPAIAGGISVGHFLLFKGQVVADASAALTKS